MSDQGDHVVLKCSNAECGMRYPSPADDARRNACPLCEAPVAELASFTAPPQQPSAPNPDGGELVGVLDNIRSAQNVGTMLRSADGAAMDHVYLGGLTAPVDHAKVIKTALGAERSVSTSSHLDIIGSVERLQRDGFEIWAVDFTERSQALQSLVERPQKVAFVVGNERAGVDPELLQLADRHVHLDMLGAKSTLNVGVTFGAVAYWLRTLPIASR